MTNDPSGKLHSACKRWAAFLVVFVAMEAVTVGIHSPILLADDFRIKTKFWAQLSAPMTAVLEGVSMREALHRIGDPVGLNLCLDRRVNPTAPIDSQTLGPTIYSALNQISQQRECVVMPVCNVVLVGRPDWVDATAAALLAITANDSATPATVDLSWPELTSPRKALAIALAKDSANVDAVALPHDLWPAQKWTQIDRRVAVSLVLAQFDLQLSEALDLNTSSLVAKPIDSRGSFDRVYSSNAKSSLVSRIVRANDSESRSVIKGDTISIRASAKAHRIATHALLSEFAKQAASNGFDDTKTFSVRRTETSAGAALTQFANAAGRQCVIERSAIEACQKRISLEANEETLKSLIQRIAQQAGVIVQWHDDKIVVTK